MIAHAISCLLSENKLHCTKNFFPFFFFSPSAQSLEKCLGVSDMSRILCEIKQKLYPPAPSGNLNIQLGLIFTSSGSSLPVEGISADRLGQ